MKEALNDYFGDFWQCMDAIRLVTMFVYICDAIQEKNSLESGWPKQIMVGISFLNLLNYLRFFNGTRIFVEITRRTFKLMMPFFMLIALCMLIFVITFSVKEFVDRNKQNYSVSSFVSGELED